MKITLITPTASARGGNWTTASRWARLLRQLGHRVAVRASLDGEPCDLLIALHARKSHDAVADFRQRHPDRPIVVVLTGTDVNHDLEPQGAPMPAMTWADRLVVLHSRALDQLDAASRAKARVIEQSAVATRATVAKTRRWFDVCVVGHLRPVKDPFRTAAASRLLPAASRIRVVHAGAALDDGMARHARREMAENPRYAWLGMRAPWQVRRLLARSHVMVLSSLSEGGANVVSEAVVTGLPVLASRIPGSVGLLGDDHPGYFDVGDTARLAKLMVRCETEPVFLARLARRSRGLAPRFRPERERAAWKAMLSEIAARGS